MENLTELKFILLSLFFFSFFFRSQNNASKLLLAIMESRHDSENAERILYNMRPKELVRNWCCAPTAERSPQLLGFPKQ